MARVKQRQEELRASVILSPDAAREMDKDDMSKFLSGLDSEVESMLSRAHNIGNQLNVKTVPPAVPAEMNVRASHILAKHTSSRNPVSGRTGEQITLTPKVSWAWTPPISAY